MNTHPSMPHARLEIRRDTKAWQVQVWVSFGVAALLCGWQAVDASADVLVTGEMGIGNTTVAAAIAAAVIDNRATRRKMKRMGTRGRQTGLARRKRAAK
jgi:hypothetical protein